MKMVCFENIKGRENLLITLGDSWTEGVGCYHPKLEHQFFKKKIDKQHLYLESRKDGFFGRGSWPFQLSTILNTDLINLGIGGDSNSASAKRFIHDFDRLEHIRSKYKKITVIWLLSDPNRFSFYTRQVLNNFLPNLDDSSASFVKKYFQHANIDPLDSILETSFYVHAVYWFCKANGLNFVYGSAFSDLSSLKQICKVPGNIHQHTEKSSMNNYLTQSMHAFCNHPNTTGYYTIAAEIKKILELNFKEYV
jgi:hypothetical protein